MNHTSAEDAESITEALGSHKTIGVESVSPSPDGRVATC